MSIVFLDRVSYRVESLIDAIAWMALQRLSLFFDNFANIGIIQFC